MSTLTKNSSRSLGSDTIGHTKLAEAKKYIVELSGPLLSVDVEGSGFRNFINLSNDKDVIFEVKNLLKHVGTVVELDTLPIKPPEDELSYFLMNDPNSIGQQMRYGLIQRQIGFKEELRKIVKYEYASDFHRVFVFIEEGEINRFRIIFFDPFHHVALGYKGREELYWNYERCSAYGGKSDCLSKIPNINNLVERSEGE